LNNTRNRVDIKKWGQHILFVFPPVSDFQKFQKFTRHFNKLTDDDWKSMVCNYCCIGFGTCDTNIIQETMKCRLLKICQQGIQFQTQTIISF
jgi:hypothetical protein